MTPPKRKSAAREPNAAPKEKGSPARKTAKGRKAARQRHPSSSDILGLLVVALTATLGACTVGKTPGGSSGGSGPSGSVTVRFLDVGQGDAVLVRSPEGKTMLVDGGRSTTRMAELLQKYQIDKIDLMVATHADADHIAGLVEAAKTKPTLFINNGLGGTTQTWDRLVSALQDAGTTFQKANNQSVNLGSVKVQVLAPPSGVPDDQNNHSVGIRVDFGKFHALMTGDSETPETNGWLDQDRSAVTGPMQVYKSIHHGAANGDHQAWLAAVRPENVVISVGPNNYGHPTETALTLYRQNGIKIFRTDEQGNVTFTGKADGTYKVNTEK